MPANHPIRIALSDSHRLFRHSLESLLNNAYGYHVVISCASIERLVTSLNPGEIDILIVDIKDFDEGEWLILAKLIHRFPELRTMVLTAQISKAIFYHMLDAGVDACYSKNTEPNELLKAIKHLCEQGSPAGIELGPGVKQMLVKRIPPRRKKIKTHAIFSNRELQILSLICAEYSSEEISEKLELSLRTIETHRSRMIKKTNSRNIVGVVLYAVKKRIYKVR